MTVPEPPDVPGGDMPLGEEIRALIEKLTREGAWPWFTEDRRYVTTDEHGHAIWTVPDGPEPTPEP